MIEMQSLVTVTKDAEDVGSKAAITVTSGGVKDIDANTGGRVEVRRFHSFAPDIEGGFVVEGATRGIEEVGP